MFNFRRQKKEPKDLKEILSRFKNLEENFEKLSKELENLKKKNKFAVQKLGIVRFNPFREVGGDQSFSIALLDDNDTGAILTNYYSRKESKIYGKPIKCGQSEYPLSEEEQEAMRIAKNGNKNGKKLNGSQ